MLANESDPAVEICISVPLILEYETALRRLLGGPDPRIDPVLDYFCTIGVRAEIFYLWRPFLRDPADEMILEAAVSGQADAIITHNTRDFRNVTPKFGVHVLTPGELLRRLGGES
jgi:hypothetical protein